jgi:glutamine amidotransferase
MIAIINYKAGNLASVANALKRLQSEFVITSDISVLETANGIIFPGVGHAKPAMESLRENKLDTWLKDTKKPVLGICLGMQLLFSSTEEGDTGCLEILEGRLKKFSSTDDKVPHMGWNTCIEFKSHALLNGINPEDYFYYVHSYFAPETSCSIGICKYAGVKFSSMVAKDNFMGVQFHPEKSGKTGEKLLSNFLQLVQEQGNLKFE